MLRRIDRLILRVPHLEAAVRYYRDVLGLQLIKQDKRLASLRFAEEQTELVLHADPDLPAEAIYYRVADVRDLFQRREALRLQFVQAPVPVARGYRAAVKDPFGNLLLLVDRTLDASGAAAVEDAKPAGALFPGVQERPPLKAAQLIDLYEQVGRTADDLPYTPQFERLYARFAALHGPQKPSRQDVWRSLLNLRKGGKLPRLGEARSRPPQVSTQDRQRLLELLGPDLGKRDRLPYSERFDQIVDQFNQTQPRALSPHLVWRLVASLAK